MTDTPDAPFVRLVKTQALGNDFLLLPEETARRVSDLPGFARRVCRRHHGIGADGLIVVAPDEAGATTRLLNADGSPSEVSGNGVRAVAAWLASERRLGSGATLVVGTGAGPKRLTLLDRRGSRWTFRADMGAPEDLAQRRLAVLDADLSVVTMRVGNPQCVVLGPATEDRLGTIAAALAVHPAFPHGTNVELADVEGPDRVRILIWERGVGRTEASGTGACAAAVAAVAFGGMERDADIEVRAPGGSQTVRWSAEGIALTGWAEVVADVQWRLGLETGEDR